MSRSPEVRAFWFGWSLLTWLGATCIGYDLGGWKGALMCALIVASVGAGRRCGE